jgi:predicted ribosomally synthesized peptide with SipW-like signal peptide
MHRILLSVATVGSTAALIGGATFAVFTASASNTDNVFTTGTVNLATAPATGIFNTGDTKLMPGDALTKSVDVTNGGSLAQTYGISAAYTTGSNDLYNALELKIGTTSGGSELFSGLLSAAPPFFTGRPLSSGATEKLYFTITLPLGSGDSVQNASATATFTFTAEQG